MRIISLSQLVIGARDLQYLTKQRRRWLRTDLRRSVQSGLCRENVAGARQGVAETKHFRPGSGDLRGIGLLPGSWVIKADRSEMVEPSRGF
jgi:hypothetical protein